MRKFTFLLSLLLAVFTTAMAQVDTNKEYRVKDVGTGKYMNASNYDAHPTGPLGGVNFVDVAESDDQVFTFFKTGTDYMLRTKSGKNLVCQPWNVDALDAQASALTFVDNGDGTYYIMNGSKYFKVEYVSGKPVATIDGQQVEQAQVSGYFPYCDAAYGAAAKFELEVVETTVEPETPAVPDAELAETYNGKVSMEFFGSPYELDAKIVFGKDENGAAKEGYATLKIWESENFNVEVAECVPYEVSGNTVVLKGVTVGAGDGSVNTKNIDLTFTVNEDGTLSCSEKVYGPTPDTAILQFDFAAGVFTPEAVEPEVPAGPVVITDVAQLSNNKCYTLVSADTGRGGLYALADKVDMCGVTYNQAQTCHGVARDNADPKQQFAFVEYEGKHYLYSVSEKKFVMKSGDTNALVGEAPFEFVTVEKVGESTFALKANDTNYFTASPGRCSNASRNTCIQSTLTSHSKDDGWDEGAWFTITEVADFNPEEALAMLTPAPVVEPVTFVKSTPAAGSTVETLSVFTMTFNKELASVDPEMMMMLYGGMNPIPSEVQINGTDAKTITVTLQEPYSLAGGYIYYIAAGSLVAADGSVNEEDIMLEYNIEAAPNSFGNVYSYPASGSTVESLVNVRMGFMGEVASVSKEAINVVDGNGTTVTTATLATDDFDFNAVELTLAQEITAGGTYKIVIPENYIVSTSGTYNPELTLTYTIEGEEVSEEVLALIAKAEAALEKVGVGYPSEASNGRNNLVAAVANVKETASQENVDALNAALNAYYGETSITLPESGKAYTFTMVAKNGNKFYLNYTGSDIAMVAATGEELPASAKFFATENSNGTFSFQTNDGKYLVYHSKYAGVNWLEGGSTTGLQDELSDMTDITLQKMVNGNKVEAVDNEQIFGLVTWYSKRGYDTGKAQDAMGYMVLKTDGSDYDGADAPFWNMNYSSAFLVEEAQVALNTLNPESVEPAEPAWWDAMEDIENVTINFPEEITYNEEKPVVVMFNDTDNVEVTVAANAKQLVVTFPANLKIGEYVVNVPEGAVVAANGTYNPALKYTYNVDYAYNTFEPTSITPAAGEVESLKTIVLDFGPSDWPGANGLDQNAVIELTNASGEVVATGTLSYSGYTGAAVTLDKEITALGLYTLVIPEGSIWNSKFENTEEKGVYKGARCNPTIELTYSIGTAATVTEVSPAPGHYEEIPADIAVTFSKEIGTVNYLILRNNNTGMRGYYFAEDEYTVEGNRLSFTLPADMISYAADATVQIQVMDKDGFPVTYAASEDDLVEGYVMLVYTAPVRANIFSATKVDPKEGEVTELSVFNVTFESLKSSEGMSYVGGFDETKVVEVLDAEGNQVATATMEVVNNVYREEFEGEVYEYEYPSSVAKFTLDKTITAAGTYTLVIPEATVFNEGFYPDSEDFGIGWGALYNPETRFVYTIKDASAISGVEVEAANGKVYNLQGVRVANKLQKGVYIVNGKKVYVK